MDQEELIRQRGCKEDMDFLASNLVTRNISILWVYCMFPNFRISDPFHFVLYIKVYSLYNPISITLFFLSFSPVIHRVKDKVEVSVSSTSVAATMIFLKLCK